MSECGVNSTHRGDEPQVEVIGDEIKSISLNVDHPTVKHVCILSIDPKYTIEAVHGDSPTAIADAKNQQYTVIHPHDTEQVLQDLDTNIIVETVYLTPNARQSVAAIRRLKDKVDVFINLYDNSDDTAKKIIEYMQNQGIAFTGSSLQFCDPTRIELKRLCRYNQLPAPKFALVTDSNFQTDDALNQLTEKLGSFPLFVKPEHGYDSVGISEQSLVRNVADLKACCSKVADEFGAALVEEYIEGREFTVFVAGTNNNINVFPPVEYHFPANKSFITFEDKWGVSFTGSHWHLIDENKGAEEQHLVQELKSISKTLYQSFNGDGYARIDIRQDRKTKNLSIIDINPNCSVFYKGSCSADLIVEFGGWTKSKFMQFLLDQALERQRQYYLKHSYTIKYSVRSGFSMYASRRLREGDLVYTNENHPLKLVTKKYAEQIFNQMDMAWFHSNAWPICDNVYVLWHEDSAQWQPINHSCDPNLWMDGLHYVARRCIDVGEELTIDYSTYTNTPPDFECWCGAAECRRQIRSDEYKEKWFQDRYGSHINPYILMLIEKNKITTKYPIDRQKNGSIEH